MTETATIIGAIIIAAGMIIGVAKGSYQLLSMLFKARGEHDEQDRAIAAKLDKLIVLTAKQEESLQAFVKHVDTKVANINARLESNHLDRVATEQNLRESIERIDDRVRGNGAPGLMSRVSTLEQQQRAMWKHIDELKKRMDAK